MKVGTITETKVEEYRVGLTPAGAAALTQAGHEVLAQRGAGLGSGFSDAEYEAAGAALVDTAEEVAAAVDLLVKVKSHEHALGHCYRCHTAIEPYLSDQWFVKMKPLAEPAKRVVEEGKIKFYPRRWTKVYLNWIENIRDW